MGAKTWQMLKQDRVRLHKLVMAWAGTHGRLLEAEDNWHNMYTWCVATSVGRYVFSYDMEYGNIMGRFVEPHRAAARVACNKYSGKWNFHFGRCEAQDAFEKFRTSIERIL